jgi:hypothetical protein
MNKKLVFSIDGVLLSDYGLHVETVSGLIGIPKRKPQISNSDTQSHGKFYDLGAAAKYDEKSITLNCFVVANSRLEFFAKINEIVTIFDAPGLHRLTAALDSEIELPFEVIRVDGDAISPNWNSSKTLARFQLKFVEPQPIKRVVNANGGKISLNFHTDKLVSVSWGDKTYFYDLVGDVSIGNDLTEGTQVVIMGDIEEIKNFNLNGGAVQWDIWS